MDPITGQGEQRHTTSLPIATGNERIWGSDHRWLTIGLILTILERRLKRWR